MDNQKVGAYSRLCWSRAACIPRSYESWDYYGGGGGGGGKCDGELNRG